MNFSDILKICEQDNIHVCFFFFFSASVRNCGSEGRSSSRDVITVMPLHQISPRGRVRSHPFELANVGWIFHFPPLLTEAS